MGCRSNRKKQTRELADTKWDYVNLQDFRAKGCGPGFAYAYLWLMLIISIAVYVVDSFTAVNLLVFNRWSSKIEPTIPFDVSKWIFSICILLSFVNLGFENIRAMRVMKRGNIAECFLDNLAVRWESIRFGNGQGWRRFLVFAELAKSRKGSEYVALFTYFSFQSWIRVIFCSGPRQVVNALTLRSVYIAKLSPTATSVDGAISGFFDKIKVLAEEDYRQAVILSGMVFTLVIWIFSALFLLTAVLFYVFFLFHWIPRADGGLSGYCERKINKKLLRIVTTKVNKALAKGEANRYKSDVESAKKGGEKFAYMEASILPTLPNVEKSREDGLPQMPTVGRDEKTTTLPVYTSRPGSPGSIEMGSMDRKRPVRTGTTTTISSYSSRAPLVSSAAEFGYSGSNSPTPSLPSIDMNNFTPPTRPGTSSSSQGTYSSNRSGFGPMNNQQAGAAMRTMTASPAMMDSHLPVYPGPARTPTGGSMEPAPLRVGRNNSGPTAYTPHPAARPYQPNNFYADGSRGSPAPSYRSAAGPPPHARSVTGPMGPPPGGPRRYPPQRNMTAPVPPRDQYRDPYDRSGTSHSMRGGPPSGRQAQGTPPGYWTNGW